MTAQLSDYLLRLPPTSAPVVSDSQDTVGVSSFGSELRQAGLWWRCGALLATHLAGSACWLGSWICLGSSALRGRWDSGWLAAWGLALAATVPLRFTTTWLEGVLTVGCGGLLRQRLFAGALRMETEVIRRQGPGALLSEILEAEAIDTVGVRAAVRCLLGALELLLASLLLAWTAGGEAQAWVLGGCVALLLLVAWRHVHQRAAWSRLRLSLTHHLVENMTAHRTRIAQQAPAEWHRSEDEELERYGAASLAPDRTLAFLEAGLPRLYLVLALSVLALRLLGPESSGQGLALQLGSVLFAALALERVCATLARGAAAWVAWRAARPMFDASGAPPAAPASPDAIAATGKALEVGNLCFTHRGRSEAALGGCSFAVERGTRTLIQGTSGSGKSTLAALLGGLREPSAGFVLAGGVDRFTLGPSAWRRRVAVAPQQHENHVLSASLAFNLLLARPFPHTAEDHADAAELCAELGLSPLLARMPAGLQQIVGETGWRLSQGERSRVFLARALLQNAEVVVLDESFAGLDPESLRQCLDCAARRARTLIVIAHP